MKVWELIAVLNKQPAGKEIVIAFNGIDGHEDQTFELRRVSNIDADVEDTLFLDAGARIDL